MTLEQLKAFCAIVDQGGFRAAADSLFRSQSAVSIAVRKLEEELDIKLFRRESYRPELTDNGRALYQRARPILKQSEAFRSLAQHLAAGEEPDISLAVSGIVPIEPLLTVLNSLALAAPATRISLQIENLSGAMERLDDEEADITITDVLDDSSSYESVELTRVQLVTVVHPDSLAASRADTAGVDDLEHASLIIVRDTSVHSERLTKGVIEGTPQWTVNDFMMKRRIIKSGTGWGRMPLHLVKEDIENGELVMLSSADFQSIDVSIDMVRMRGRPVGPVEQMLWQRLTDAEW
ncbi:MAG: LysR family transcriptional regulator [Mariprofundaceae bacterium]